MNAKANALINDRINLTERIERYQSTLLPQSVARTEAVERDIRTTRRSLVMLSQHQSQS